MTGFLGIINFTKNEISILMNTKACLVIFASLALLCIACSDKDCLKAEDCLQSEGIYGRWNWTKSIGGLGGQTVTPQSTGESKHLIIDDFTYSEYEDDELVYQAQYDLAVRADTFNGISTFLILDPGNEYAIRISDHELEILEMSPDGWYHYYERK